MCKYFAEFAVQSPRYPYSVAVIFTHRWEVRLREKQSNLPSITQPVGRGFTPPHRDTHQFQAQSETRSVGLQVSPDQPQPPLTVSLQGNPSLPLSVGDSFPSPG